MSPRVRSSLVRFVKGAVAALIAYAVTAAPSLPLPAVLVPVITAALLGLEKALRWTPDSASAAPQERPSA